MRFIGKLVGPKQYKDILSNDWRTCKARQEGVIGIMPLSSGYYAAVTVRWTGVGLFERRGIEFSCDNVCGTIRFRSFFIGERLGPVMGSNEKSAEVPESLEVRLTAFFKLVG